MSICIDPDRLRYEIRIRGLSPHVLATRTGLSDATVSAVLSGRRIAEASLVLIVDVLEATPVNGFIRSLLGPYEPPTPSPPPPPPPPPPAPPSPPPLDDGGSERRAPKR